GAGSGAVAVGDVDGDGALDLVLMFGGSEVRVYLNDGTGVFTELVDAVQFEFRPGQPFVPYLWSVSLVDADRDFDLDLITNVWDGDDQLWINDGSGVYSKGSLTMPAGLHTYRQAACDVDGDGDLDVWNHNGTTLYRNDGGGTFTDVTATDVVDVV